MRLVKMVRGGKTAEGVLQGDDVRIIGGWHATPAERTPFTLGGKSASEVQALLAAATESVRLADVTLAVPIDPLAQIFCAGFNYRAHVAETSADEPKVPVIFKRTLDTLVAHGQPIIRPKASVALDYECEILAVIGRAGRYISEADALSHVGGYSCFMDGSIRDYQKHSVTSGKNFWRTGSLGPWIVTADEIGTKDLALATLVDGEQRQSSKASLMIFSVAKLIAYCSTLTQLQPGDVIATGTPAGVGARMTPPNWLKPGQTVEVVIDVIGTLRNPVADEAAVQSR